VLRHTVLQIATEAAANPRTRRIIKVAKSNAAARQAQISQDGQASATPWGKGTICKAFVMPN
jgi:hypothetical protein